MDRNDSNVGTIVSAFHDLYYSSQVWRNTWWQGTPVLKCPLDLWIYQEIVQRLQPDLIVECGTWAGGASLFLAHMLDLTGNGQVATIDVLTGEHVREHYRSYLPDRIVDSSIRPKHPRITYLLGSSIDPGIVNKVTEMARDCRSVLVIADSDHSRDHALAELECYHRLVTPGSYFIMEDTNIAEDGPWHAVEAFLLEHAEFETDRSMEKFYLTFNPRGYLRRKCCDEFRDKEMNRLRAALATTNIHPADTWRSARTSKTGSPAQGTRERDTSRKVP